MTKRLPCIASPRTLTPVSDPPLITQPQQQDGMSLIFWVSVGIVGPKGFVNLLSHLRCYKALTLRFFSLKRLIIMNLQQSAGLDEDS